MAKVRVYELARDLNMTNKNLLDKLVDLDISVKSHMSVLDEDSVNRVKAELFGGEQEAVEETRIKPTVIRRRKKAVPAEAQETPEPPPAEDQAAAKVSEAEPPTEALQKETAVQEPPEAAADEKDAAAVEEPEEEPAVSEKQETARPAEVSPETAEQPPATRAKAKPAKVKKEKKSEPAAKIIKLPVSPPAPKVKRKKAASEDAKTKISEPKTPPEEAAPTIEPTREPQRPEAKKRKGKARADTGEVDKKFLKKKISFRRKAVVEGDELYGEDFRIRKPRKGAKAKKTATGQKTQITTAKAIKRRIKIDEAILVSDLAKRMGVKANEVIKALMATGIMATVNQSLDFDTASVIAAEFSYDVERASFEEETILKQDSDDPAKLTERPPVVTIMGHVDHGKTSLLDVIRKTRVTESEAGGITQHIGAYHVSTEKGQIAFLDTPGHEAFTAMRARGAQVTDIVVLVVAADDGVMPQTIEAINHSKAANVPIIVAVNKIDKANAEPDRVKRELSEQGLTPEEWGGDTIFVNVSAKQATGIDELLEMILLQAEVLELKANPEKLAIGHVVEAKIDAGRGAVATVLVRDGSLHVGNPVVCGVHHGKIRAMLNDRGNKVQSAGPSIPVEIVGLSGVPMAGDELVALHDEKDAKQVSLYRTQQRRSRELTQTNRLSLDKLYERMQQGEVKELKLIIRADVHGSIEALSEALTKLSNEEVNISVIHSGTGTIAESDISLATVSNAIIIGFNVRPNPKVQALVAEENVDMRFYDVIYDVIKDVKDAIVGMMEATYEEHHLGTAEVREVFQIPRIGSVAGCYVTDGKIERGQNLRVVRDGVVVYDGKNSSLRRFKDDVKEVQSGYECGIGVENFNDIKVGDILECYYLEEIKPAL